MSRAGSLDHVGIVGPDLDRLAVAFEALGFHLTPLAQHAGGRTGNRCVMLRHGYLELLAVIPGGASATIERFLAHHPGAHTVALGIDDAQAVAERLARAGLKPGEPQSTDRAVEETDPAGPRARFTLITLPDRPEGRFHLIRHQTPEALWQPRFLEHPNRAIALAELVIATPDPAETAAFLSRLAGRPVTPDPAGGYALDLPHGRVRALNEPAAQGLMPGQTLPPAPCMAAITVRTDDATRSVRALLAGSRLDHRIVDDAVVVTAGGVAIRFVG
jgi:hypothetical protein